MGDKTQMNQITISGVVKDKESGETLPFANVFIKDTNIGTTTNGDGFFTLFNVPSENSTIQKFSLFNCATYHYVTKGEGYIYETRY